MLTYDGTDSDHSLLIVISHIPKTAASSTSQPALIISFHPERSISANVAYLK
jgi:hypothetical protein